MLRAPSSQYIYNILYTVQQGFSSIYSWIKAVLDSIFNNNGALHSLMPLFVVSIAVSIVLVAIIIIKKVIWS